VHRREILSYNIAFCVDKPMFGPCIVDAVVLVYRFVKVMKSRSILKQLPSSNWLSEICCDDKIDTLPFICSFHNMDAFSPIPQLKTGMCCRVLNSSEPTMFNLQKICYFFYLHLLYTTVNCRNALVVDAAQNYF
jgi:hypothetical protein